MSLTGKTLASTYKSLLRVNDDTNGIDTNLETVTDGEGTVSSISLSDDRLAVQPQVHDTTTTFRVNDKDANALLTVDATNDLVKAGIGQHIVNTNIKQFSLFAGTAAPSTADTWTGLQSTGNTKSIAVLTNGTGSTPATTLTVDGSTIIASTTTMYYWYVPFNITIDACNVWFGADANTGDVVKFSVMSYGIDKSNGSTGGDLSSGVENCVSPATITGAGDEQMYYQELTISSANVDGGDVITAWVAQDGTNSDLSVNLQLVYHLR